MASLDTIKLVDALQSYDSKRLVPCLDGPEQVSFIPFYPQSRSTSSLTFVVNVPSLDTGLDRRVLYRIKGTATINGTITWAAAQGQQSAPAIPLTDGLVVGLSESPLDQICSTESVNFSNKQNSVQRSLCGVELNRMNDKSSYDAGFGSGTNEGSMKDFASYFEPFLGTNRDVLAPYSDVNASDNVPTPRTSWLTITAAPNVAAQFTPQLLEQSTTMTVAYDFYSFSAVSPFSSAEANKPCIRGLNSAIFQLQFQSALTAMFSVATRQYVNNGNTYTFAFDGATNYAFDAETALWAKFITPSRFSTAEKLPSENVISYREVQTWQSAAVAVPADNRTQVSVSLQQITGSVIPSKLILAVRPVQSLLPNFGANEPRTWFPIADGGVNLKFNNTTILNGANQRQLYNIAVNNGLCQMPYEQWIAKDMTQNQTGNYAKDPATSLILGGGFLVINPAKDCQILRDGITNGTISNWALTGSLQLAVSPKATTYANVELCVIAIYEGFCRFDLNGGINAETGLLTRDQVLAVLMDNRQPIVDTMIPAGSGISVGKHLANAFGTVKSVVETALKHKDALKNIYDVGKKALGGRMHHVKKHYRGRGYDDESEEDDAYGGSLLNTSASAIDAKRAIAKRYL